MATRSIILSHNIYQDSYRFIYVHNDGDLHYETLVRHWNCRKRANRLVSMGDLMSLRSDGSVLPYYWDEPSTRKVKFLVNVKIAITQNFPNIEYVYIYENSWKKYDIENFLKQGENKWEQANL